MLIPLRVDVPMSRRPWANYALMGVIILVSIYAFFDSELFSELAGIRDTGGDSGDRPGVMREDLPLPVLAVSCTFLHGGWLHLIGNMIFLWVFGNAVNYKFGHLGYAALYLASAFAGSMAHYGYGGGPAVGASGAIYGVIGAFVVFFPRNDVTVLWFFWFLWLRPGIGRISSVWPILFWVAWDIFYLALGAELGVAFWGHIGGFCAGLAIALTCALLGLVKPTQDEQTLLQLIGLHRQRG